MKNILSFFAIAALLFTACEKPKTGNTDDPQGSEQIRLISNDVINVGSGAAMGLIQYEILEMVAGAEVKAEANVSWIGNFDYRQQGKINFTVERNPNAEPREGVITVSYDKSKFEVKIIQALSENPTNKEIKSPLLQGKYYGSYSGSNGLHNYYLAFTDLGMDASNNFYTPNAYYY
ncbi:MAG: BACON domain-containing protein, partial [Alistipes sp.]|nr:BACON domain-containing protein [Alistipes sp.]